MKFKKWLFIGGILVLVVLAAAFVAVNAAATPIEPTATVTASPTPVLDFGKNFDFAAEAEKMGWQLREGTDWKMSLGPNDFTLSEDGVINIIFGMATRAPVENEPVYQRQLGLVPPALLQTGKYIVISGRTWFWYDEATGIDYYYSVAEEVELDE